MKYDVIGGALPVAICKLEAGESMINESGSMSWMSPNMKMETVGGGIGKIFSRMATGEKMFQNRYTAEGGPGEIAFAASFPGSICAYEVGPGRELILQKSAFLAATEGVNLEIFFNKKLGSGFFGGEGFIMQKVTGTGMVLVEIDGHAVEYNLEAGQQLVVDTGYLAMMDGTCSMDIQKVSGVKNVLFGGEGLFNTIVTGPGKVVLQSMPLVNVAGVLRPYFPSSGS